MRVFVSGATGYLGSRLVPALLAAGHEVTAGARRPDRLADFPWSDSVRAVEFDALRQDTQVPAMRGADAAVYLVHSLENRDFVRLDARAARGFARAAAEAGVGRVVYQSGLVPEGEQARHSRHIRSRLEVEEILLAGAVPTLSLRAAIIVGAGSTSFEIVRRLTERLPVIPIPSWMNNWVQPIAVVDVLHALGCALADDRTGFVDIGGPEIMTYPDFIRLYADVAGIVRPQVAAGPVPAEVVGRSVARVSGLPRRTVTALARSVAEDMVCTHPLPSDWFADHPRTDVASAIRRALSPARTGTAVLGDPQSAADTDADWSGGHIEISGATRYRSLFGHVGARD
ncbi:hypothetical protein GCM10022261_19270 [Brevibacterium daeguense]|uniref:NAD(P)-binding domain-containing protein n=1 Tax=Brevibacterium daeguense TaxID=909936 RepID=A0ABP8EKB8_9MICO|nr:NAD(P)H-binding protein [Brevibacterium daeguense]